MDKNERRCRMKSVWKHAFTDTLPVLTGYLVLGFGFGMIMKANGFSTALTFAMSLLIYAGSMQYVAIGLFTGGASLLTVALTYLGLVVLMTAALNVVEKRLSKSDKG